IVRQQLADDPGLAEHYLDLLDELGDGPEGEDMIASGRAAPELSTVTARAQAEALDELIDAIADRLALATPGAPAVALIGASAADRAAVLAAIDRRVVGLGRATLRLDAGRDPFVLPLPDASRAVIL